MQIYKTVQDPYKGSCAVLHKSEFAAVTGKAAGADGGAATAAGAVGVGGSHDAGAGFGGMSVAVLLAVEDQAGRRGIGGSVGAAAD